MLCPYCKEPNTQVIDSRTCEEGSAIRRRRKCPTCGEWNTMEEEIKNKQPRTSNNLEAFKNLQVGKKYRVSDNAVRKWCSLYGILDKVKN